MFLLLHGSIIIGQTESAIEALKHLAQPDNFLAETIVSGADPRTAIPGELDRAITAWNEMTGRVNIHIDKVKNRARLVAPYRKWKKAIGRRDYLLEQLIPAVEAQPYIWTTIRFPWLLRVGADFNSDKIHARAYGKGGNGNGQATERDYLQIAARVATYNRWPVDGESFEHGTGVTYEKWEALRKQFSGNGVGA